MFFFFALLSGMLDSSASYHLTLYLFSKIRAEPNVFFMRHKGTLKIL